MKKSLFILTQSREEAKHLKLSAWPLLSPFVTLITQKHFAQVTKVKSSKAPFNSKCKDTDKEVNLFFFKYTKQSCLETCGAKDMLKKCGRLLDFHAKFAPYRNSPSEHDDKDVIECIKVISCSNCSCPLNCEETS